MSEDKKQFIEILQLLSSKEEQDEYQKNVPHVDISQELICMWFDDLNKEGKYLKNSFTDEEMKTLSEFSKYYEERLEKLPDSYADFWSSPVWSEVAKKAGETLEKLKI